MENENITSRRKNGKWRLNATGKRQLMSSNSVLVWLTKVHSECVNRTCRLRVLKGSSSILAWNWLNALFLSIDLPHCLVHRRPFYSRVYGKHLRSQLPSARQLCCFGRASVWLIEYSSSWNKPRWGDGRQQWSSCVGVVHMPRNIATSELMMCEKVLSKIKKILKAASCARSPIRWTRGHLIQR